MEKGNGLAGEFWFTSFFQLKAHMIKETWEQNV